MLRDEIREIDRRHTPFHEKRLAQAMAQSYDKPVTAFLSDVFILTGSAVGTTFGHVRKTGVGRFADGHRIHTSYIVDAVKVGRFWVLTTLNSTYVVTSIKPGAGRQSFRKLLQRLKDGRELPVTLH